MAMRKRLLGCTARCLEGAASPGGRATEAARDAQHPPPLPMFADCQLAKKLYDDGYEIATRELNSKACAHLTHTPEQLPNGMCRCTGALLCRQAERACSPLRPERVLPWPLRPFPCPQTRPTTWACRPGFRKTTLWQRSWARATSFLRCAPWLPCGAMQQRRGTMQGAMRRCAALLMWRQREVERAPTSANSREVLAGMGPTWQAAV